MRKKNVTGQKIHVLLSQNRGFKIFQVAKRKEERRSRTDTTPPGGRFLDPLSWVSLGWSFGLLHAER